MTTNEAKTKLVSWCLDQVGYVEGANNWNKYAPKWTEAGGWNAQNQPWCDIFVDCAFIECFGLDIASRLTYQPRGGFSALCSASANFYKANNAWFSTPQVGDQVFMNVSGGINHTGVVVGVSGGVVTTVEGNSSDGVRRNSYGVSSTYIAGFGRPNWGIFSSNDTDSGTTGENTPSKKETCSVSVTLPVIRFGDCSRWVKLMQTALITAGFSCGWYGADGEFGAETKVGLFKYRQKLGLDGEIECNAEVWKKLLEA